MTRDWDQTRYHVYVVRSEGELGHREPIAHTTTRAAMEAVRRLFEPERTTFWPLHLNLLGGTFKP